MGPLLIALLAVIAPEALAYSPEELLASATSSVEEVGSPGDNQYLNPITKFSLSYERGWGDGVGRQRATPDSEIRYRETKPYDNSFSLSIRPKGITEFSTYRNFSLALKKESDLTKRLLVSKALLSSYSLLVNAAQAKEELGLIGEWKALLERTKEYTALGARRSEQEAKGLLKANSELAKANMEISEAQVFIREVSESLKAKGFTLGDLESAELLSPSEIEERLPSLESGGNVLSAEKAESEAEVARTNFSHSVAERSRILDGIKFSYKRGEDTITRRTDPDLGKMPTRELRDANSYGVELSFNLPFLAAQDLGEQKDKIKLARDVADARSEASEANHRVKTLAASIRDKVILFHSLVESTRSTQNVSKSILRQDPGLALELQRTLMYRLRLRTKLLAEIRSGYLELLFERGLLASQPKNNHLSKLSKRISG